MRSFKRSADRTSAQTVGEKQGVDFGGERTVPGPDQMWF